MTDYMICASSVASLIIGKPGVKWGKTSNQTRVANDDGAAASPRESQRKEKATKESPGFGP